MRNARHNARLALLLCLVLAGLLIWASTAAATNLYLRPNADNASPLWSVTGASTRWDALNDSVTESETPSNADYITHIGGIAPNLTVELGTTSLAGTKLLGATAWFYTPDSTPITMSVIDGTNGLEPPVLGSKTSSSPGWQSVSFSISGSQTKLDALRLKFVKSGFATGTRRIYASFVRLNVEGPSSQIYWGSWIDGDVYSIGSPDVPYMESDENWNKFEAHAGKPVSIVHFGQPAPWNLGSEYFTPTPFNRTIGRGAIPMVDMDPDGVSLSTLLPGAAEDPKKVEAIEKWAKQVAEYGKPLFLRWSWEMNGTWFSYGSEAAKNPALYTDVWKRIYNIAKAQGADNITWVWCPNVALEGSTPLSKLYPGNEYVDWTCMDGYNHGVHPNNSEGWRSFSKTFSATYNELLSLAPTKPIMIGEVASTEETGILAPETKAQWISEGLGTALSTQFPKVEALVWFNWNILPNGSTIRWDWPIESSSGAEAAFRNVISSSYFAKNEFGGLAPHTKIQPLP